MKYSNKNKDIKIKIVEHLKQDVLDDKSIRKLLTDLLDDLDTLQKCSQQSNLQCYHDGFTFASGL